MRALPSESAAERALQEGRTTKLLYVRSEFLGSNVYHAQHDFVERIIGTSAAPHDGNFVGKYFTCEKFAAAIPASRNI